MMMAGIALTSAIFGSAMQSSGAISQAQANEQMARRMVYNAQTDEYYSYQGAQLTITTGYDVLADSGKKPSGYRYPSKTPANWVEIEDQKDRELALWLASVQ